LNLRLEESETNLVVESNSIGNNAGEDDSDDIEKTLRKRTKKMKSKKKQKKKAIKPKNWLKMKLSKDDHTFIRSIRSLDLLAFDQSIIDRSHHETIFCHYVYKSVK
jgi:hypothetical protein